MRNHLKNALLVVLALVGAAACSADVGDRGDTLRAIDEQAMTSQLLYLLPDVSPFPMTAVDLDASGEDAATAIPVRVEVFEDLAVAWFAPAGIARVDRQGIVALWRVENRTPIAGELENNAETGVVNPGIAPIFVGDRLSSADMLETQTIPLDGVEQTILDFFDILNTQEEVAALIRLGGYHPGCL